MKETNDKSSGAAATETPAENNIGAQELDALRKQAAERDQYLDLALRTKADFENYQKRSQREREQEKRYWYTPLVLDLLPAIDNLERALAAAQQAGDKGPLVQGVAMVQNQFLEMLKRHGITRIEAANREFDPNVHQAVMQQPTKDVPPGRVTQVLEQGFMNQDRVLRPAKVIVSSKPAT